MLLNFNKYCSKACRSADPDLRKRAGAANWRGDKAKPDAGRKRAQAKFRFVRPCEKCRQIKMGYRAMVRHHRDHDPLNNSPENVAFLCRSCHINEHRQDLLAARRAA